MRNSPLSLALVSDFLFPQIVCSSELSFELFYIVLALYFCHISQGEVLVSDEASTFD